MRHPKQNETEFLTESFQCLSFVSFFWNGNMNANDDDELINAIEELNLSHLLHDGPDCNDAEKIDLIMTRVLSCAVAISHPSAELILF